MRMATQVLRPQDRLAIVTYDDQVERPLELTSMTDSGKEKALNVVNSIHERGCTNLSGGMLEGLSVLSERRGPKNDVSSILLLTDGHANRGITGHSAMVEACQSKVSSMKGATSIYTFGYGKDHASELLDGIARATSGQYYFVSGVDSIAAAFGDALGGLMTCVAQNIRMEIVAKSGKEGNGVMINNVTTSFKTVESEPGKRYVINIGDMMSEESRDILVDLKLPAADSENQSLSPQTLYDVKVTYWNVPEREDRASSSEVRLCRTAKSTADGAKSNVVEEQKARIEVSHAVDQAREWADNGDFDRASAGIKNAVGKIKDKSWAVQYMQDLREVEQAVSDSHQYMQGGTHLLRGKARKHQVQRSNECTNDFSASSVAYTSAPKRAMKARFSFR